MKEECLEIMKEYDVSVQFLADMLDWKPSRINTLDTQDEPQVLLLLKFLKSEAELIKPYPISFRGRDVRLWRALLKKRIIRDVMAAEQAAEQAPLGRPIPPLHAESAEEKTSQ